MNTTTHRTHVADSTLRSRYARSALLALLALSPIALGCGDDDTSATKDAGKGGSKKDAGGSAGAVGSKDAAVDDKDGGSPSTGATWAMMGYDTKNQYWNPNETTIGVDNAGALDLKWTFTVAGFPPGSPVIAEGLVFVLATGGLYAIDLDGGGQAWSNPNIAGTSSVAYSDGFIYVHAEPLGQLYKLRASDGHVEWGPIVTYSDVGGAVGTSSPIVADDKVLTGHTTNNEVASPTPDDQTNARGGVFAGDIETGDEAWQYYTVDLPENGAMVWSTVSVDLEAGVVYATTGNNYTIAGEHSDAFHAIDLKSGQRLWATQIRKDDQWTLSKATSADTDFGANPILADVNGKKLVAAGDKASAFWALDRETGEVLWSRPDLTPSHTPANGGVLNNGAFDGKYFYVVANDPGAAKSKLFVLDPEDGKDVWTHDFDKVTWGAPSLANGVLYVPIDTQFYIFNAKTGEQLAVLETGGTIAAGAAAIADGHVIVQSGLQYAFASPVNNNQIHCYAPKH